MQRAKYYRERAKAARLKAKHVDADVRDAYILLAEGWQALADALETPVSRFQEPAQSAFPC